MERKICKYHNQTICFRKCDFTDLVFIDKLPDGFKTEEEFLKNIEDREKLGCEVCHFKKAGFTGSAKIRYVPIWTLAC